MSDDLDDLLRRAMKTLDDQVPSGYFEALPNRTLARLEDSSMQTTGTSDSGSNINAGVPPQDRDEDSGLHDIRSMASSAKLRISSRRISTSPPMDDDILASSSAGWKAVALPEPAKMVSLPSIDQLPSAKEVKAQQKADRQSAKQLKAERTSAKDIAHAAIAVETSAPVAAKPAVVDPIPVASVTPIIGARFAKAQQKSRTGLYAIVGLGLAAAAGAAFYVTTMNKKTDTASAVTADQSVAAERTAEPPAAAPTATASVGAAAVAAPDPTSLAIASETGTDTAEAAANDSKADENDRADKPRARKSGGGKGHEATKDAETKPEAPKEKPEVKSEIKSEIKKPGGGEGEPSFDDLLKEAGVADKKPAKVILDKKSLSGGDIKKGMGGISGKAQGCFAGTQGTAKVKLTVAPSGVVQKVTVSGVFAGTPVGACVESAVKGASFPPWDGGPQSFGYSFLLAE